MREKLSRTHENASRLYLDLDSEYRGKKAFHSIFINVLTARIICIHCQLEILDLDQ